VSPKEGEKKYGEVKFADSVNKKYPLDTEAHVRAAWSYINMPKNAAKYSASDLKTIKGRIKAAMGRHSIKISDGEKQAYEALNYSTDLPVTQDHYHIEGSIEEHLSKICAAFCNWKKEHQPEFDSRCGEYYWAAILGVLDESIIFYVDNYSKGIEYYEVGYTTDTNGEVAISGDVEECDVKLVMTKLDISEEDAEDKEEQNAMAQKQDKVADGNVIAAAAAAPVPAGFGVPVVTETGKGTEANSAGSSVEDISDASVTKPVTFSDENGASAAAADGSEETDVEEELAKTKAGYKGMDPGKDGTPKEFPEKQTIEVPGIADIKDDAPVVYPTRQSVQGMPYDLGGMSMCHIQSVKKSADGKTMTIQGIATRGDIVNQSGQVYPLSVWEANLAKMNELASQGKFLGKLEHPVQDQGLVDTAIKWDKFWLQGADLWFDATVVPTEPHGKNLQALLEAKVQVDMSTRGYGTFKVQDWRGVERPVMQDDFICTAIDAVWQGASTGSGVKAVSYQSTLKEGETVTVDKIQTKAAEIRAKAEIKQTRDALLADAGLNDIGMKAYAQALNSAATIEDLIEKCEVLLPSLQAVFGAKTEEVTQSSTYQPTFFVKATQEESAPQNVGELLDRLCADLPDHYPGQTAINTHIPNHFRSPREACKRVMINVAREQQGSFSGRDAALGLLALEQGKIDRAADILTQSINATGGTTADGNAMPGGAPLSNYLIFPLIRRVYPQYIMNEIASIQPMDRPEGKIFFLDHYRASDSPATLRVDLNTSANPFNSSYSDNATEGAAANYIRLKLSSQTITAHTKKLGADWSIEEMQDLRAYHGLDAAQELLGGIAREMALEWNKEVLDDMLAQATASARTFGQVMPASFSTTQKDWDEYIWVYIQALDNDIFSKRNGPMTHIIAGVDAALALAKSMRGTFTIGGPEGNASELEMYPGTSFFGTLRTPNGSAYKVFKTNFWGTGTTNGSKILGLRRGSEWSDTPYIFAPYTDYVTPMLTDPADFSQKQGIISRAAKKVVVPDAIGYLTVSAGQGVVL
jgi:hypothetical protein